MSKRSNRPDLIFGVGVNDADYPVILTEKISKGCWKVIYKCPYYVVWKHMIERGFCEKLKTKSKSYRDCTVCEEWLTFSNFKSWMELQDWKGKELDKDLLFIGNKLYSPETCCFIGAEINTFIVTKSKGGSSYPLGVSYLKARETYTARCNNPITGKCEFLGSFKSAVDAHFAWREKKHDFAMRLSLLQTDKKIAAALAKFYSKNNGFCFI